MIKTMLLAILFVTSTGLLLAAGEIDCSEAYGGKSAKCERVACHKKYHEFLGTWSGPFQSYDQAIKGFRPFRNKVTYSEKDCLKNAETGDTFIIGRRTDIYPKYKNLPAKTQTGLLITGKLNGDEKRPFLRTVDAENGAVDYEMVFTNDAAEMTIWKFKVPKSDKSPEMIFTTMDARDFTVGNIHKRLVVVVMEVISRGQQVWSGPIVTGYHSLKF